MSIGLLLKLKTLRGEELVAIVKYKELKLLIVFNDNLTISLLHRLNRAIMFS